MQTSAFRDKRAIVIWSLFGHEAKKYVLWEPSLLHFLFSVNGNGLTINLTNPGGKGVE